MIFRGEVLLVELCSNDNCQSQQHPVNHLQSELKHNKNARRNMSVKDTPPTCNHKQKDMGIPTSETTHPYMGTKWLWGWAVSYTAHLSGALTNPAFDVHSQMKHHTRLHFAALRQR